MQQNKILVIDDDIELTELITSFLNRNGFTTAVHHTGDNYDARIDEFKPDLIVLDLMLPGTDGLTICRNVRHYFDGPIIMLTALSDEIDEVTGLEVGADDYLTKPVRPRVLLAHIRAQLRRQGNQDKFVSPNQVKAHNQRLVIDAGRREVTYDNQLIALTNAEFDLLWHLAQQTGVIVSRDQLHQQIFRLEHDGLDRSIDLRISRLRKKLGDDPRNPDIIKTIRSKGYLLAN